jgi:hypothetical protein
MRNDIILCLSQKFRIETVIDIEGEQVPVRVDGSFDIQKGTYTITPRRTTKTVATSAEMNEAIMARVNAMTNQMIGHFEGMRAEISGGDDGPNLFDGLEQDPDEDVIHAQDQIDYDTGDFVEPAPRKPKGRRAVSASSDVDADGGTDDELNPGI